MSQAVAWRDRLISFRVLGFLVLAWGLTRLLVVVVLPPEVTTLAPDEAGYAELIAAVASGRNWAEYGYGAVLWPQGRSLLAPASWLALMGVPAFTSARVVSVLYSTGAAFLMLGLMWLAARRGRFPSLQPGPRLVSWPIIGLAIFILMPSHALWGSLGMREAATEFWVLASVALAALLFTLASKWWHRVLLAAGITMALALAYQSRGYMAVALSLALAVGVVGFGREKPRISLTLAASILAGTVAGVTLSLPVAATSASPDAGQLLDRAESLRAEAQALFQAAAEEDAQALTGQWEALRAQAETLVDQSEELEAQAKTVSDTGAIEALQQGAAAATSVLNPDTYLERGSYQREVSSEDANSAIPVDSCAGVPDPRSLRLCEITRLPGAAFAVMFRPLWPLDVPAAWSPMAVAATVENVVWLVAVAAALWSLVTRRSQLPRVLGIAIAYGLLLVAGMAILEGNLGTAFRHKSNVLWVFCLVMIIVGMRRTTREHGMATTSPDSLAVERAVGPPR